MLLVSGVATAELALRRSGFEPSIDPEGIAWQVARDRVGPDAVVLAGTSRLQTGIDPEVWARAVDGPAPVQLSMVGTSPLPIAESLLADPDFRGTIVLEVMPRFFWNPAPSSEQAARAMLAQYDESQGSPSARVERWIWSRTAGYAALQSPEVRIPRLLEAFWERRRVERPRWRSRRDRFTPLDGEGLAGPTAAQEVFFEAVGTPADSDVATRIDRVRALSDTLRARGGELILVRLPTCGLTRDLEERYFPRSRFWDRLTAEVGARAVMSLDHPELLDFTCADGSHLDYRDVPDFTRRLAARIAS